MSYIHFFDFDIRGHDEILFHNWISINIAAKMNPGKEIILWLTKEIKTNYYLLEIIKKFHIRSWNDNFSNCRIANDLDKVLCKLLTLQKYPGSSLDLNDVHITPQPVHLRGLNFISENPQKYPLEVKHNFIVCNDEKYALDSTISDLAKARRQTSGLVIPAILHANVANRFVFANGIENSEFSCYLSSANGLEKLFVDRSNEIPDQSFSLSDDKCVPILSKINERNVFYLNTRFSSLILKYLEDNVGLLCIERDNAINLANGSNLSVNFGSGSKFNIEMINTDFYREAGADLVFDLTKSDWPLRDNSVAFAMCHSVLEHLSGDLSIFFKELYRVMIPNGLVQFVLPHPRHDWFFQDPTHVRPLLPISFEHFDRKKSIEWYLSSTSHTPLALYWGIDFRIKSIEERIVDMDLAEKLSQVNVSSLGLAKYFCNNIIGDFKIVLEAIK